MIDISIIDKLERIGVEERRLAEERASLTAPMSYSFDKLSVVHQVTEQLAWDNRWVLGRTREYFLFVALFMFAPSSIIRKMRRGLRKDLSDIMGVSENNISHITRNILFKFRVYEDFQNNVEMIYERSVELLNNTYGKENEEPKDC